ncbi:MAG: hypothetical protein H8K07_20375 [Nitrospira sp.]|nr:hypothetical protein [Nitrospira sp.]
MSTLTIEVLESVTIKKNGQVESWHPGQRVTLPPEQAKRIMAQIGHKVRLIDDEAMDEWIGRAVAVPTEFKSADGKLVEELAPWIVEDVFLVNEPGLVAGRWLLLSHGSERRFRVEAGTRSYKCPKCSGSACWSGEHTVQCVACVPPTCPQWGRLWRQLAELTHGIPDGPFLQAAWDACDEASQRGNYAAFQTAINRVRWTVRKLFQR